jgi:hypothetical protein
LPAFPYRHDQGRLVCGFLVNLPEPYTLNTTPPPVTRHLGQQTQSNKLKGRLMHGSRLQSVWPLRPVGIAPPHHALRGARDTPPANRCSVEIETLRRIQSRPARTRKAAVEWACRDLPEHAPTPRRAVRDTRSATLSAPPSRNCPQRPIETLCPTQSRLSFHPVETLRLLLFSPSATQRRGAFSLSRPGVRGCRAPLSAP